MFTGLDGRLAETAASIVPSHGKQFEGQDLVGMGLGTLVGELVRGSGRLAHTTGRTQRVLLSAKSGSTS